MEDYSIRAIVIGVSLFVTMLTLTAILMYFNTARSVADDVNKRTDIANSYDYIMNEGAFEDELSGVEVRSLIHKYAGNSSVNINVSITTDGKKVDYKNVNNTWLKTINENAKLINEKNMDVINPSDTYTVNKVEKQSKITIDINLVVED